MVLCKPLDGAMQRDATFTLHAYCRRSSMRMALWSVTAVQMIDQHDDILQYLLLIHNLCLLTMAVMLRETAEPALSVLRGGCCCS